MPEVVAPDDVSGGTSVAHPPDAPSHAVRNAALDEDAILRAVVAALVLADEVQPALVAGADAPLLEPGEVEPVVAHLDSGVVLAMRQLGAAGVPAPSSDVDPEVVQRMPFPARDVLHRK